MYEEIEVGFASARRLLEYNLNGAFGATLGLKGFNYSWIVESRDWNSGDRVLDVGAGYSRLPIHVADTYGAEVWAADDFGLASDDPFWTRGQDPTSHIESHPQVRYVRERLGDPGNSELPPGYFDCVYSASTLEHVPASEAAAVWRHMDSLLKPGGVMLHGVDIKLPSHRGLLSVLKALVLEAAAPLVPRQYRLANALYTPKTYLSLVNKAIGSRISARRWNVGVIRLLLDPDIVLEPLDWALNRVTRDGITPDQILRVASLLIHLRKPGD